MKKTAIISTVMFIGLVLAACRGATGPASATPAQSSAPLPDTNLTRVNDEAAVAVEVTPLNLDDASAATLDFEIALNTHSVDLSYDFTQIAVLQNGAGEEVQPVEWDGPTGGGHHVSGTLSFPRLKKRGQSLTLILHGVADVPERTFVWNASD